MRELRSGPLLLRPCGVEDRQDLHDLWTEPEVRRWFWDGRRITVREVEEAVEASQRTFSESGVGIWSVFLREGSSFVGTAGLLVGSHPFYDAEVVPPEEHLPELMYAILPGHRRHGYASRSAKAVLAYGFEVVGLKRVVSVADAPNEGSSKVLERCGMSRTKTLVIDGQTVHLYSVARTAADRP